MPSHTQNKKKHPTPSCPHDGSDAAGRAPEITPGGPTGLAPASGAPRAALAFGGGRCYLPSHTPKTKKHPAVSQGGPRAHRRLWSCFQRRSQPLCPLAAACAAAASALEMVTDLSVVWADGPLRLLLCPHDGSDAAGRCYLPSHTQQNKKASGGVSGRSTSCASRRLVQLHCENDSGPGGACFAGWAAGPRGCWLSRHKQLVQLHL